MINFFRNLHINSLSFWIVFITGILFAWFLTRLRSYFPKVVRSLRKSMGGSKPSLSTNTDTRLHNEIYHFAQKQHLASSLFSLDEIAIVPKVLTPLIKKPKSIELEPTDSVSLAVPYIPDWPELAAVYRASTMTLLEALQGNANIILAGHPGSGKTVALAWLTCSILRKDAGLGNLEGLLPLYVHATDIYRFLDQTNLASNNPDSPEIVKSKSRNTITSEKGENKSGALNILIKSISTYVSPITLTRLPRIVRVALENKPTILLIDKIDELPPNQSRAITDYIESLLIIYPKLRIVAALSFDDLAGLPRLGFSLLAMAAWTDDDRDSFVKRWGELWDKWISPSEQKRAKTINSQFLNSWLKSNNSMLNPLEYTLKIWAAYSGDALGPDGPSAIESYIHRMTSDKSDVRASLELFALQLLNEMEFRSNPNNSAQIHTVQKNSSQSVISNTPDRDISTDQHPNIEEPSRVIVLSDIESLVNNGFLIDYTNSKYGFSHPIFSAYLAGSALSSTESIHQIQSQPPWCVKNLAMYYYSRTGDVTPFINELVQGDDILHTNHLMIARWLQIAPKNRQWRTTILRTLTTILQKEKDTLSLAAKIISAMAFSGDVGISIFFRQLLKSDHPNLKQLAALGCGILAEKKAIEDLNSLSREVSPLSIRAASLALAAIGDKQSLEVLAFNLLNGSEISRRSAAEALANDPTEGHAALKEGSTMEDIQVRRSVPFGLVQVDQPWAIKIVENMQLDDKEWVVRNAAIQAIAEFHRKNSYAPMSLSDPTEIQWLIEYATRFETSVAPGKPADDLIQKVLMDGSQDEILKALDYLREKCDANTIDNVYRVYSNSTGEIKDAAYQVLWLMMISGSKLPVAVKYDVESINGGE